MYSAFCQFHSNPREMFISLPLAIYNQAEIKYPLCLLNILQDLYQQKSPDTSGLNLIIQKN
jgi:hypothetical protein